MSRGINFEARIQRAIFSYIYSIIMEFWRIAHKIHSVIAYGFIFFALDFRRYGHLGILPQTKTCVQQNGFFVGVLPFLYHDYICNCKPINNSGKRNRFTILLTHLRCVIYVSNIKTQTATE
jgi:hypothetical protein